MRQIISEQISDLSNIYAPDVELVSIARKENKKIEAIAKQVLDSGCHVEVRWEQSKSAIDTQLRSLAPALGDDLVDAIDNEILLACETMDLLLGCSHVGIRLGTLRAPMCPRFYVDQVPCRMLTTLCGSGTEWIAANDVDRRLFAKRNDEQPPVSQGATTSIFPSGHWSLLKGGTWDEDFFGVVHRSPRQTDPRLFLSIDPIFNDQIIN
ncbi:DUF1826 domain-containing protein [Pseudomonadales bacterium]|nr:DUF1826 domain-containing protein [Pseudomonadales bacterium]